MLLALDGYVGGGCGAAMFEVDRGGPLNPDLPRDQVCPLQVQDATATPS